MFHIGSRSCHVAGATSLLIAVIVFIGAATLFMALRVHHPDAKESTIRTLDLHACFVGGQERAAGQVREGRLPLWDPYQGCGTPLAAQLHFGPFYPPNVLHVVAGSKLALDIVNVLHVSLAGMLMWLYCRTVKLSVAAAFFGATVFMLAPFLTHWFAFPPNMYATALVPAAMLAAEKLVYADRHRSAWAILLGLVLSMQLLAGSPFFALATGELVSAWVLVRSLLEAKRTGELKTAITPLLWLVLSALVCIAVSLPQIVPTMELSRATWRGSLTAASYERIMSLVGLSLQEVGHQIVGGAARGSRPVWFYTGIVVPVLSLIALGFRTRGTTMWRVRFLVAVAAIAAVCSAKDFAIAKLVGRLLMLNASRTFYFFPMVYLFSTAFVAAAGFDSLLRRRNTSTPRWTGVMLVLTLAVTVWMYTAAPPAGRIVLLISGALLLLVALLNKAGVVQDATAERGARGARPVVYRAGTILAAVALLGVTVWDLLGKTSNFSAWPRYAAPRSDGLPEYIRYLQTHSDATGRVWSPPPAYRQMGDSFARSPFFSADDMLHDRVWGDFGIYAVGDVSPFMLGRYCELAAALTVPEHRMLYEHPAGSVYIEGLAQFHPLSILCTRFWVVPADRDFVGEGRVPPGFPAVRRVFDAEGVRIYEDPTPLSRAHWVDAESVQYFSKPSEALQYMCREEFDPFTEAVIEMEGKRPFLVGDSAQYPDSASKNRDGGADVELVMSEPDRVQVDVHAPRDGFLVLADTYYPGWRAYVNGTRSRIYRANYLFRAVALPAGDHTVVFRYCPTNFYVGTTISLLVLAGICFLGACRVVRTGRRAAWAPGERNGSPHEGGRS